MQNEVRPNTGAKSSFTDAPVFMGAARIPIVGNLPPDLPGNLCLKTKLANQLCTTAKPSSLYFPNEFRSALLTSGSIDFLF